MDYKVPTHAEIDDYFSTNPMSEWHLLNITEKNENDSYPKYASEYAKKLRMAMKTKGKFFMNLAEKIVDRVERREPMKENEIDIRQKQTMRDQLSESKALDEITNAIVGKRKRDDNDDDEIDNSKISKNGNIEPMVQENYEKITTSEKGHSNGFEISSFGIEVKSKQISTWDYVIQKWK
ncbi:5154_t:CDS:2 [Paraglomus occultum]|uniref:5154_t:CDS:1 n=1 Tax=Paraglomus occultum TaxID=144539 RepID=A0A9N8VPN5_9GLOM|nr:5154_t:CDS:2 [Paraglomus occultum]